MSKNLPSVTSVIPRDLRNFIDRLRELVNGSGADRLVTAQDLADAGVVSVDGSGNINAVTTIFGPPPAPTNVTATPAIRNVIVEWDIVTYPGHAYAEVWGADTDDLGAAELLGQTPGFTYTDSLGPSSTRYYWVRYVNTENVTGSYNSTNGTAATTGADLAYTMDLLRDTYGGTSEAPFFQLDSPTEINGVTIPAGTYMKAAFIYDAEITNAKIANLAVDTAKLADASITTAKIGDAQITTAKIADANITTAKIGDAQITSAKIVDANITLAKIDTASITSLSALSATLGSVTAGTITSSELTVGSSPAISGTTMTGSGTRIYSDGQFVIGNAASNIAFNGTAAYLNGFTSSAAYSSSGSNSVYWPANTNTYQEYSSVTSLSSVDASKPVFLFGSAQLGLGCTSVGNPAPPARVDLSVQLEYRYSTNGGASYTAWANYGIPIRIYAISANYTSVSGFNRNFFASGGINFLITPAASTTNIQFRFNINYQAFGDNNATSTGYFGGVVIAPYTEVSTTFTGFSISTFQIRA